MRNSNYIENDFWRITERGVEIYKPEYFKFLEMNGFGKIYLDKDKLYPTFIRVVSNVVREVSNDTIVTFSRLYIMNKVADPNKQMEVFDTFIAKVVSKSDSFYNMLKVRDITFLSDTKDMIYFYFENTIIQVTSEMISELPYSDAPGVIWEKQIIPYNIELNTNKDFFFSSEFNSFLNRISEADLPDVAEQRYLSILSITGYLIHEYRDLSNLKAIILMDSNLSYTPEGGAGKGLFVQAIKQVRETVTEDGKNFKFDSRFMFQQVRPSTKVLFFDDVTKKFDFEKLFSTITDGIVVEQKYKHRITIPAERSPRIVASTNYAVLGIGGSFERRRVEFEFSRHYSQKHSPVDEFGHLFFKEWDSEEWSKFYNFLFFASGSYLRTGLKEAPSINKELKQLIHATSPEFYDFSLDNIQLDSKYSKKSLHADFTNQYPDFKDLTQRTFTSWLRIYAEIKGLRIDEQKSNSNYYVKFSQLKPI